MSQIKITLLIDLPDGAKIATPDVDYRDTAPQFEPPLPEAPPPDLFQEAARIFNDPDPDVREYQQKAAVMAAQPAVQAAMASAPVCAIHGNTMKRWPAGTSKKNGKPFNASWRCSVQDCTTKPIWDRDAA